MFLVQGIIQEPLLNLWCYLYGALTLPGDSTKAFFIRSVNMTVKEIAEAVGQTDRSVRNWVKRLAEKDSVIAEKLSVSSPMKPADYTLAETCSIIETGMGKSAADVYRTNAVHSETEKKKVVRYSAAYIREVRLTLGKEAAAMLLLGERAEEKRTLALQEPVLPEQVRKQVYAVARAALIRYEREKTDRQKNMTLFDDNGGAS